MIGNVMTLMWHHCSNNVCELCLYKLRNALIGGPTQWGMRYQNTCFVWNALTVVFILVFWSCAASNSREPTQPAHLPASGPFGLLQPGDQMRLVWPSFPSTQICNFLDSFKWSMVHIYLLDWSDMQRQLLSNLRLYSVSMHVLLFVFKI